MEAEALPVKNSVGGSTASMSRPSSIRAKSVGAAVVLSLIATVAHAQPSAVPQADTSDVATLPTPTMHWVYVGGDFTGGGVRIFDADTAKMKGTIEVAPLGDLGLDPLGRNYYVAETIWSKINRGTRQDMVSVYDNKSLKLVSEITLPYRLLGGTANQNFAISSDGHYGFVYTLQPSSSIEVVDLQKRKLAHTVQIPGCAAVFPSGRSGVGVLCSDGSLATVKLDGVKPTIAHTAPFFTVSTDPVFDTVSVDRSKAEATFLSYSGEVYTATLGDAPKIDDHWSIQQSVGMHPGIPDPPNINWLPGGEEPFAVNRTTGRMYVLMHPGEQWSQKEAGQEIWVVDLATHKVLMRHASPEKAIAIQVSQDDKPLIYLGGREGKVTILDGATLETNKSLEHVGGGVMFVADQP